LSALAYPKPWANGEVRQAVDLEALEQVLLRVSEMVCELPQLREMDINPIIVDESGAVAVDARIVIDHAPRWRDGRPATTTTWPSCRTRHATSRSGRCAEVVNTPCVPFARMMPRCCRTLVQNLSPESRYFRFVSSMAEVAAVHAGALHADRLRPRNGIGRGGQERQVDDDGEWCTKPSALWVCHAT
jgi:acetyltransferase